jgi:hypothetical protein
VNKLNIFMVNVLRFRGSNDLSSLVDKAGAKNRRFDIYGGKGAAGTETLSGAVKEPAGSRLAVLDAPVEKDREMAEAAEKVGG